MIRKTTISAANNAEGFTLIELAVASAIASLILLMAYTSYRTIIQAIGRLVDREAFYENVNNAFTVIDRDLANAYFRRENNKLCFIGETVSGNSVLNFVTVVQNDFNYQGDIKKQFPASSVHEVGYSLQKDPKETGRNNLIRREEMHYDENPEQGGENNILIGSVVNLRFEFKEGNDWTDRWDSRQDAKYPNAVKTTMTVIDYENLERTFIFYSIINMK